MKHNNKSSNSFKATVTSFLLGMAFFGLFILAWPQIKVIAATNGRPNPVYVVSPTQAPLLSSGGITATSAPTQTPIPADTPLPLPTITPETSIVEKIEEVVNDVDNGLTLMFPTSAPPAQDQHPIVQDGISQEACEAGKQSGRRTSPACAQFQGGGTGR